MTRRRLTLLGGGVACNLPKGQNASITIAHDELSTSVGALFRSTNDLSTATAQILGERIKLGHVNVGVVGDVIRTWLDACPFCAIEVNTHFIPPDYPENRRSRCILVDLLTIPKAGKLETENIPVVVSRSHDIAHSEVGCDTAKANAAGNDFR